VPRIEKAGGKVVRKAGAPRFVWNRPHISFGDGDSVRILTDDDEIPFFPITWSLGAYWSYSLEICNFVVSAEPDFMVIPMEVDRNRCLILGTHGLWEVLRPKVAVVTVQVEERHNSELKVTGDHNTAHPKERIKSLVDRALYQCFVEGLLADNITVITVMLDPPGRCRAQIMVN
jgi:protein phosphatase 1D